LWLPQVARILLKGLDERDRALTVWRESAEIFDNLCHPEGVAVRAKLDEHPR